MNIVRRNPFALYSMLRRCRPVLHDRVHDLWLLFDYESVRRALDDFETFSSRAAPPGGKPLDWMIFLDPPLHTKMRAIVMRTFTPRAVLALEPQVRERVERLLDRVLTAQRMDVVADLAEVLPVMVIGDMLGLPQNDEVRLRRWADAILHIGDTIFGGDIAARALRNFTAAEEEMRPYVQALAAERRTSPKADLLTRLVQEGLPDAGIMSFFELLLLAGTETTTNLIGNAVVSLIENRDALARVDANRALLPAAIEEVLRYRSPVQIIFRQTTREVTLHGRTIPAGKLVLAVIGSANRDRRKFANPHRFEITRAPNDHIAFGHGAHFCIGATLARLEARVALTGMLDRMKNLRLTTRRWEPRKGLNVYGPERLPIEFTSV